jgi:hypothetical protein
MSTYSAKQVYITYSGVQLTGYAPDTFCNIERNTDDWKPVVGAGGEYVRSQSNDTSAKSTIKLLLGSLSNSVLFGLYTFWARLAGAVHKVAISGTISS